MSRLLGQELPGSVRRQLASPSPKSVAVPLITLDEVGFPHVALLSFLEMAFVEGSCLFWLYSDSSSVRWLEARPECALVFASEDGVYYVKGRASPKECLQGQAIFRIQIDSVLEDLPTRSEGDAALSSGLRFRIAPTVREEKLALRSRVVALSRA